MDFKSRLRNYGLWVSVASLVLLVLQSLGVPITPEQYNEIVNTILGILVMLGILNNPTTENKWFSDDK